MRSARRKAKSKLQNGKGQVFYGLHMYPGVAEYRPPNADPYRIYISERVIREMGPTFQGAPLYSLHRDDVPAELDKTKNQADGWVVRSFYNEADGKHWTEFVVTSERGLRNIRQGYKLSNAYFIESEGRGGVWNGVDYDRELLKGEYEHLALVPDPRYDSMILTPDEFKAYNEQQRSELKKVANSKSHKDKKMAKAPFSLFKRTPVTNGKELAATSVMLEKSKKEVTIAKCIELADSALASKGKPRLVNGKDLVKIENEEMTVDDIVDELVDLRSRVEALESGEEDEEELEDDEDFDDEVENEDDDMEDDEEDSVENEDDDDAEEDDEDDVQNMDDDSDYKKPKNKKPKTSNSSKRSNKTKKQHNSREDERRGNTRKPKHKNGRKDGDDHRREDEGKERSRRVRHANNREQAEFDENTTVDTSSAQVARGLQRYG